LEINQGYTTMHDQTIIKIPPSFSAPPPIVISKPLTDRTDKKDELPDTSSCTKDNASN